jgi:beta-barrel assembly-enhancing protease
VRKGLGQGAAQRAASAKVRVPRFARSLNPWHVAGLLLVVFAGTGCISEEREQEIGDRMASEVNPHLPLVRDPLLNAYMTSVGETLASVSARPDLDYRFYLINTDAVNAFALPGGHIYVTRGLVERTQDGAEFAGVLAHEIGHVAARHGVRKLQRHLRTGSLVNVLYNTILGGEPALLRENSLQLANIVWSARHSRGDEKEADRLAVRYLMKTGVDPDGVVTLLETLLQEEADDTEVRDIETWFSTHPLTQHRIDNALRDIARLSGRMQPIAELDLQAFTAFKMLVHQHGRRPHAVAP